MNTFGSNKGFGTGFGAQTTTPSFSTQGTTLNFGSATTNAPTTFGSTFGSTATQGLTFSLGNPTTTTTTPAFGTSFGTQQPQHQQQQPSYGTTSGFTNAGFGSTNTSFGGANNTFGGLKQPTGTTSTFGLQPNQQQQQQAMMPNNQTMNVFVETITNLKKKYSSYLDGLGNPIPQPVDNNCRPNTECKFSFVSYKPVEALSQSKHHMIEDPVTNSMNPDPENYFAVKEYGIHSLLTKYQTQQTNTQRDLNYVVELNNIIQNISKNSVQLSNNYDNLNNNNKNIKLNLLLILKKIELLRAHGKPLQHSEVK